MNRRRKKWKDLSASGRTCVVLLGAAQVALAGVAYRDLLSRPDDEVEGTKLAWGIALLVNWVGPLAYLAVGRRGRGLNEQR